MGRSVEYLLRVERREKHGGSEACTNIKHVVKVYSSLPESVNGCAILQCQQLLLLTGCNMYQRSHGEHSSTKFCPSF